MTELTQDRLKYLFDYKNGELIWKNSTNGKIKNGTSPKTINHHGYKCVWINYKNYMVHRLIYFYHYGVFPKILDHKNGNKLDNRIENLRPATSSQNNYNRKKIYKTKSGVKGVYKNGNNWMACCSFEKKEYYLGTFKTIKEAEIVVKNFRQSKHKEFARHT